MPTVVGIFETREGAERAASRLQQIGLPEDRISVLTPDSDSHALKEKIPQQQGEQPGIVKGIAAAAGGAMGLTAAASLIIPGVGPVLALGMAGGALLGALAGSAIGGKLEESIFPGIPEQELFLYEDALRKGRTGVIAIAAEDKQADAAKGIFEYEGAESIDRARQMWWLGIRDVEKEKYAPLGDFEADEPHFREGFEAALLPRNRNKTYEEHAAGLIEKESEGAARRAYRHGYERGRAYLQAAQKAA